MYATEILIRRVEAIYSGESEEDINDLIAEKGSDKVHDALDWAKEAREYHEMERCGAFKKR